MKTGFTLTLETSNFLVIIFDDISATIGTPFDSGIYGNSTPNIVNNILEWSCLKID